MGEDFNSGRQEKIQLAAWAVPELGDTGMQAQGSVRSETLPRARLYVNQIRSVLFEFVFAAIKFEFVSFKMLVLMTTFYLHARNANEETNDC